MTTPKVAILIVNWNGRAVILDCLASLSHLDYASYEIIIVDNGSNDGSVEVIREQYPKVTLIEAGENLGFVGGNNLGLKYAMAAGFPYMLLLNNDTEIQPDFLRLLVESCETDSLIGIVGPTIYYYEQPKIIWSAGGQIDWQSGCTSMVGIDEDDCGQCGIFPREMDFVTGCALLIRGTAIEQAGLLDDRFFMYYEETEWCVRVARAGFKVLHVPKAKIWHKITPVARESSPQVHYYMTRNRLLFLKLTQAHWKAWINTIFEYSRTLLSWTIKHQWQHKAAQKSAMWQAITDFCHGRFGRVTIT